MFNQKVVDRSKEINTFVEFVNSQPYGTIIEHASIAKLFGVPEGSQAYYGLITRANKSLLECGRVLKAVMGVGYQIVIPDDYVKLVAGEVKRAHRRLTKAGKIYDAAPVEQMTPQGKERFQMISDRTKMLKALLDGPSRLIFKESRKPLKLKK